MIARAQALRNVSQACREFGISRTLFSRWRRRYLAYGPDGLHPRRQGPGRGRPPTLTAQEERSILALAVAWPTWQCPECRLLTDRTRRRLAHQARHIEARRPGEAVCVDTFSIGKLKGVGKVWQSTACDAASSYAIAEVATEFSARAAARFLTGESGRPLRRRAGSSSGS